MTYVYFRGVELYLDPEFTKLEGIQEGHQFRSQAEFFAVSRRQDIFRAKGQG
jgi:hypothetical protein